MDKVMATILLIIAAVIGVILVVNVTYPAIGRSSGALVAASQQLNERIKNDISIILSTSELDGDGDWQDTNEDGNFDVFVDDLAVAGADGFIFEPLTDLEYIVERYGQTHVIIGNIDTRILQFGTPEEIRADVKRCAELGRDCPGYFFAVGNHIPYTVPIPNVECYLEAIEEYGRR